MLVNCLFFSQIMGHKVTSLLNKRWQKERERGSLEFGNKIERGVIIGNSNVSIKQ